MSAAWLLSLLTVSIAPPPPPPGEGTDDGAVEGAPEETPEDTSGETAPDAGPGPNPEVPLDERYDPILPYGENPDESELQYADETPPPPELQYADEAPPDPEVDYDQSRQRPAPSEEAMARESDEQDDLGKRGFQGRVESPQRFLLELKFGPYLPSVDNAWTGSGLGPYATIFGETDSTGLAISQPKQGLFSVLGFEWQFFHAGGPLSIGTTVGYFQDSTQALIAEPTDPEKLRSTADKANFHVIPVTLLLGYRFELLADRFRVPLVPYARGGVAYGFWVANKGGRRDRTTNSQGQASRGGSFGWQTNLGLMLRMDFIDRAASVDLDRNTGINHTYIFGEWQFSRLNGFGSGKAMSVGDDTYILGVALAF